MAENWKKAALFVGLTFVLSWLLAGIFYALGGELNSTAGLVMALAFMFVPMTGTIVVQKLVYRGQLREPMAISFRLNRWFLVAWLLPLVVAGAVLGVGLLFPGVEYSPEMRGMFDRFAHLLTPEKLAEMERSIDTLPLHPFWLVMLQGLVAGATINAVAGFGEELGWRGFLQKELGPLGFWRSSLLIGFIWGVWHAPIILQGHNYPEHPVAGVFMMTAFCMLWAPILSYVTIRAKSVIAAAVMHGSLNGTAGLAILVLNGGSDQTIGVTGLAGFIVLVLANLALFVFDRYVAKEPVAGLLRELARKEEAAPSES